MIFLNRFPSTPAGTFGELLDGDAHLCYTAERPADDPAHPCIPAGWYQVEDYQSPTKGDVWLVMGVKGRSMIEIHPGNFPLTESLGCILPGQHIDTIDGVKCVTRSKATMAALKSHLGDSWELTVRNATT